MSTQSLTNRYLCPAILDLMQHGVEPAAAIERALAPDQGCHLRQVQAVNREGRTAAWTGKHCVDWSGERTDSHTSVAGNLLAGPQVVSSTLDTFAEHSHLELPDRPRNEGRARIADRRPAP